MFKMPIGLYEKALPAELCWEERLAAAGKAGYDFVEISVDESEERLSRLDSSAAERAALRSAIANTGVPIMTMCLSGHRKFPLGSRDPANRKRGFEILANAIEFGSDIGLRVIQVMGYDVFYEESDAETDKNFREGLFRGTQIASQAGMMLGLENMDTPYADNLSKGLAIINEIDSPWLKLYPDMGNLVGAGYDPVDELRLAKKQILGVHVKDANPRVIRGVQFKEGIVPFKEVFHTLAEMDFWGILGVEIWGDRHAGQDPFESAKEAHEFVEGLIAAENWAPNKPVGLK